MSNLTVSDKKLWANFSNAIYLRRFENGKRDKSVKRDKCNRMQVQEFTCAKVTCPLNSRTVKLSGKSGELK